MELEEFVLTQNMLDAMLAHAEFWYPREGVALLFGHTSNQRSIAERVALMENSAASMVTFRVEPEEQYRLLVEAEERGEKMVGIFHSHPAPVYPSNTDLENMRLNPVVWIIASKRRGIWEYDSFVLAGDNTACQIKTSIE